MVKESANRTFERIVTDYTLEKKICFILAICISIVLAVALFCSADFKPATFDEYVPLNDKLVAVQENPMSMLSGNGTITIKNGVINYTVSNDQCEMTGTYDSEFNLVGKAQKDKAVTVIFALFVCVLCVAVLSFIFYFAVLIVVYLAMFVILLVRAAVEKRKANNPPKDDAVHDEEILDDNQDEQVNGEILDEAVDEPIDEQTGEGYVDAASNQEASEGDKTGQEQVSLFEEVVEEARQDNP